MTLNLKTAQEYPWTMPKPSFRVYPTFLEYQELITIGEMTLDGSAGWASTQWPEKGKFVYIEPYDKEGLAHYMGVIISVHTIYDAGDVPIYYVTIKRLGKLT